MDQMLADHRDEILSIAHAHGARLVQVFGSRACGQTGPESNLDVLVTLEQGRSLLDLVAIKQDVEDALGVRVDVLTHGSLSPYLRDQVLRDAVSLDTQASA